jgi:hypothetical protein
MHFAKHKVTALEQSPYSPDLSAPDSLFCPLLKTCLKGQRFASAEEVAAKAIAMTEVLRNGFQECFQKLHERWQKCVTAQGNYVEGNIVLVEHFSVAEARKSRAVTSPKNMADNPYLLHCASFCSRVRNFGSKS